MLQDSLLSNQTEARFAASAGPKALATRLLDKFSRQLCPLLQKFVVFSSVSCGRGNAGQANYGMSNSVMERVCEARVRDGLPGLAVQWGAVGDVGLVAEMHEDHKELVIGTSCYTTTENELISLQHVVSCFWIRRLDWIVVMYLSTMFTVESIVKSKTATSTTNNWTRLISNELCRSRID